MAVNTFYQEAEYYTWGGYRALAVDGTRLLLPKHPTTIAKYGEHGFGPNADSMQSMAIGSMLYDVLNCLTIDAALAPYSGSERDLLLGHMEKIGKGDLLLLDRGYPCFWLLFLLKAKEIEFCVRLKENWWLSVKDFTESGEKQRIISLRLPPKDKERLSGYPDMAAKELRVRLVRVELENGEVEVLCTSLLDTEEFPEFEFKELYHLRWREEEAYKLLKSRADLEAFSGKTARAVEQDFFAKIFIMTMCAAFALPIEEKVRKEYSAGKDRKFDQKINRTHALSSLADMLVPAFLKGQFEGVIRAFDHLVYSTREIIRPGRSNPRKHRTKKQHYMNYKKL
ncbi:IS4 family transposase [Gelidibacter sp. F2691]|nr:IS4 family transposase [Gelidibacter sp. F2691]